VLRSARLTGALSGALSDIGKGAGNQALGVRSKGLRTTMDAHIGASGYPRLTGWRRSCSANMEYFAVISFGHVTFHT